MTRRRVLVLVAVVAVAAAVAVLVLVRRGDDGGRARPAPTVPLEPPVAVEPERDEALALIRRGQARTYHARYEAGPGAVEDFPRSVEVWRRPEAARTDTEYAAAGRVERSATVRRKDGAVACRRTGDEPWSCQAVAADAEDLFGQAAADLATSGVAARDAEVRGRQGRCFTIEDDQVLELCFDADGMLLRMAVGPSVLELVAADTVVGAQAVQPPAPVR